MIEHQGFSAIWYSMLFIYLMLLVILAIFAKKKSVAKNIKEYYLAGGTVGPLAMFFTLYATQYSGNTLSAFASAAYESGFWPMALVFGLMGVTVVYFLFAEKLNILSKQKGYITPGDFILDKFSSNGLQGILLLIGASLVLGIVVHNQSSNHIDIISSLSDAAAKTFSSYTNVVSFVTLFITVSFGAAMYPQAIQRIYAAKDYKVLKKAYKLMLIMPIFTALPIVLIGILGKVTFPDLTQGETDKIVIYSVLHAASSGFIINIMLALYLVAVLAAIMSTIDSVLLTLGSIFVNDYSANNVSDDRKYSKAKRFAWLLTFIMAILAIYLPNTIWSLMIFKLEFLIQLSPAFILGIRSSRITAKSIIAGIIAGIVTVLTINLLFGLNIITKQSLYGIDTGVISVVINITILKIYSAVNSNRLLHKFF